MSKVDETAAMRNEKIDSSDVTPPAENDEVTPKVEIDSGVPEIDQHAIEFAQADAEWHKDFERKLLRKVDVRLVPLMIIMYLNNFLDRSALGQARLSTLEEDLNMSGTQFNFAISILFIGYLTMQLPSNLILTRVRPSLYLGGTMIIWGCICMTTAAVQNYAGLLAVRLFLGVAEAPFFPGVIFLMSSWYKRTELTKRIAWFYGGVALANMFGGLLAAGVLANLEGARGIAAWRWLFIINGAISVFCAVFCLFVTPNFPKTTDWLSSREKAYAMYRLKNDAEEDDDNHSTSMLQGLLLALKDYRLYIFILLQHLSILSQTFQYLFPSIVGTLGYNSVDTLLLTVPVWFVAWVVALICTWTADKTGDRSIHIICLLLVSAVGNAIVGATVQVGPRFFGMFLMPIGALPAFQIVVAWIANSFIRPMVKRGAAIAICNAIGNCASIYGTYFYPDSQEPQYLSGQMANMGVCIAVAALALALRYIHIHENKKLAKAEENGEAIANAGEDRRAHGFRYVY